jgi:hypothetical protein
MTKQHHDDVQRALEEKKTQVDAAMRENQLHTVSLLSCVSADMNCRLMP